MQLILAAYLHHRNVEVDLAYFFFNHNSLYFVHKYFFT